MPNKVFIKTANYLIIITPNIEHNVLVFYEVSHFVIMIYFNVTATQQLVYLFLVNFLLEYL